MALDNDDKRWIIDKLDAVELRFEQKLDAVELRFEQKLDTVESRFEQKLDAVESRFEQKLEVVEYRFGEKLEAMETRLLTAFHQWASPIDARLRSHTAALRALDLEQEAISERVTKLEEK